MTSRVTGPCDQKNNYLDNEIYSLNKEISTLWPLVMTDINVGKDEASYLLRTQANR